MQNNIDAISLLQKHVDLAVSRIQALKQKNAKLHTQNQVLLSENTRYKSEITQLNEKIASYEENMKRFEKVLDEAQNEQAQLEQSILNAINGLGKVDDNIHQHQTKNKNDTKNYNANEYEESNDEQLEVF